MAEHLVPFLPGHPLDAVGRPSHRPGGGRAVWQCPDSPDFVRLHPPAGSEGLKRSTEVAILNANYLRARLEGHYDVLFKGNAGNVAHEMIIDCCPEHEVTDIAKRLIDGFHAPTVSWPVAGTLMIEPTESESLDELDRFCGGDDRHPGRDSGH